MAIEENLRGTDSEAISRPRSGWITGRALLIGSIAAAGIGLLTPWAIHVLRGSYMALDFSTPAAVGLMFFLVAGPNLLALRLCRRFALSSAELITIYSMMILASAIPTMGLTAQLIPISTGAHYYASPENNWNELVIPHIRKWLLPEGAGLDAPIINHLYEGLPAGAGVPWQAWVTSLAAWVGFLLALHLAMMCMMVLLRKQWVENERIAYPLTYLPLALAGAGSGGVPVIFRNPVFWIGMACPLIVGSFIGLHYYFPSLPAVKVVSTVKLMEHLSVQVRLSFPMMGFFYLVNLETSFSLWFFNLFFQVVGLVLSSLGVSFQENLGGYGAQGIFQYLGSGAFLALVGTNLWVARGHLRTIWQRVLGQVGPEVDSNEVISYRTAFWGMIVGLVAMGWWLNIAGLPLLVVPIFVIIAMAIFLGITRIVVESGLAMARPPAIAPGLTAGLLGWGLIGSQGIVVLSQTFIWASDIRTFVMCSAANSLKMTNVVEHGHRRLWAGFWLAILLALVASIWLTMTRGYMQGGTTMNDWFFGGAAFRPYKWAADWNIRQPSPSLVGIVLASLGAIIFVMLTAMRFRFLQWPFHPIGFAIGGSTIVSWVWFPCFLTWLIKSTILRYGGMRLYEGARPLFLGFICGQYTTNLVWLIIDWLTGHTGNEIFWI